MPEWHIIGGVTLLIIGLVLFGFALYVMHQDTQKLKNDRMETDDNDRFPWYF